MPPKATLKLMAHLAESLARGTPARGKIALTIASDVVQDLRRYPWRRARFGITA